MPHPPRTLRSLRHRNYRIYFCAQLLSQSGSWMHTIALSWLVFHMTGSTAHLGAITFVEQLPALLLSPLSGVICDRVSLRKIIRWSQLALVIHATALAWLVKSGSIQMWQIFTLGLSTGVINAFDLPARQTLLAYLVDKEDIPNAIALNSSLYNCARIVGPAVAGIVISAWGEEVCFALNALSFLPMLIGLSFMRFSRGRPLGKAQSMVESYGQGWAYVRGDRDLFRTLILSFCFSFMGFSFMVLMPAMASHVHQGSSKLLGLLMSVTGLGAVAGSLVLASRSEPHDHSRTIIISSIAFSAFVMLFGLSTNLQLSLALLAVMGFFMVNVMSTANTFVQTQIPLALRGRVLSIYALGFTGFSPLGALLVGRIAATIGAPQTIVFSGMFCLGAAALYAAAADAWLPGRIKVKTASTAPAQLRPLAGSNVLLPDVEI